MDLHLQDKVVVITGGAAGIGKGIAKSFAQEGACVTIFDLDQSALDQTQAEFQTLGYNLETFCVDVCDYEDFERCIKEVFQKNKRLDVFVNNAGGGDSMPLMRCSVEEFQYVTNWNYTSLFVGTKSAAKWMQQCGGGVILNGASFNAIIPTAGKSVYSASKRAILTLSSGFAAELAKDNIRVVAYIPGFIVAGHAWEKLALMGPEKLENEIVSHRLGRVEDIGDVVAFLASDHASYINGTYVEITGGKFAVQNPHWSFEKFVSPQELKNGMKQQEVFTK